MISQGKKISDAELQKLHQFYGERKTAIQQRLAEFARVAPSEYFYELVYCLLTPQTSAMNAAKAVNLLQRYDFFHQSIDPQELLHQKDFYIRFHKTKAKLLVLLKEHFPFIAMQLRNGQSLEQLREWLVTNVKGMGYKEATHFLRNIGHRNLAILDRHILKNLKRYRVIRSIPRNLSRKKYFQIEKKFKQFAEQVQIPVDELDLLFWSSETGEILK